MLLCTNTHKDAVIRRLCAFKGSLNGYIIDRLNAIKSIFEQQGQSWVEPYETTEGAIIRREVGNHRGLYYFHENNL